MGGGPSTEANENFDLSHQAEARHMNLPDNKCIITKPNFPDWRVTSVETRDEKTGYDMIVLLPGTILFHGTSLFLPPGQVLKGWYGTFDTGVQYAFRRQYGEQGKIIAIQVNEPIALFKITYRNLQRLVEKEKPDEFTMSILRTVFGYVVPPDVLSNEGHYRKEEEGNSLSRKSSNETDPFFTMWLCERGFMGYAAHKFGIFHSEAYFCSSALPHLSLVPLEWRNHAAFPSCIFEVDVKSGEPLTLFSGKEFGGILHRDRDVTKIPKKDKFIKYMKRLHKKGKIPPWWFECPCSSNYKKDVTLWNFPEEEEKEEEVSRKRKPETEKEERRQKSKT